MANQRQTTDGYRIRPQAEIAQLAVHPSESKLVDIARRRHPTVAWWHGFRRVDGQFGAWCYLCEGFVATWARRYPITGRAKQLIDVHRIMHLADLREGEAS